MSRAANKSGKRLMVSNPPELSIAIPKLCDLPKGTKHPSFELPIDILLVTVKDCEFLSCYAHLSNPFKGYVPSLGASVYFGNVAANDQDAKGASDDQDAKVKIGLMRCNEGSTGPGSSLITVKNAITALRPKVAISVGYCSGLNKEESKLGDVVVAAKLTTYAHKIVLDGQEQSTGTRNLVSRRFLGLIRHLADGWKAPLKNPKVREVKVHSDGEILSGPEKISADGRCDELVHLYPQAMAVEMEGEGLYGAAFDHGIEWLVVKGIADFADESGAVPWQHFASVMAASVVFNFLSDASVFSDWPYYQENTRDQREKTSTPVKKIPSMEAELIDGIRQLYKLREGWLAPFPWCEELHFHLDDIFAKLKVVSREKTRGAVTANIVDVSEIFKPHEECPQPRTVLIEGKPGMGKTTYCTKLAYDWATEKQEKEECFPKLLTVLLLRCRDMKSNLSEAINDQLLPREVEEHVKKEFFRFLRQNKSNVLLVLDGLDEVPTSKLPVLTEIIQGRRGLPECRVVATARHEAGIAVRKQCDTLLEIEGFTEKEASNFISKYFEKSGNFAEKLLSELRSNQNLKDMAVNPLHTALLCLDFEDNEGSFPENKSQLYLDITECILRRYRKKKGLSETEEDIITEYDAALNHLGRIALNGLLEDKLGFEERELKRHADELPEFEFLSVQTGGSKMRLSLRYSFQHQSFQEWFAAFFLSCQLMEKTISPKSLVAEERYAHELKEVLPYTCGLLAARCKRDAVKGLTKRMMEEVNKGNSDDWLTVVLECTRECKQKHSTFQADLARELGSFLELETLEVQKRKLSAASVAILADVLKYNKTVTELNLRENDIGDAGAARLAGELQFITTLKVLKLNRNGIGDAGAADLAAALKFNTTLTELFLSGNCIGEAGVRGVADALKSNKTLTELDLSVNQIGDAGAAALADGLKSNTTLIVLYLSATGITKGATGLADGLKSNTTLSTLHLARNSIGDAGASGLTDLLKSTTTQSALNLAAGRTDLLKSNTTFVSTLDLSQNRIGDAGAAGLADALKSNTTPTVLDLSENFIGVDGIAAVADGLKFNKTLTELNLSGNQIGVAGASGLADGLEFNTTLTVLNLSRNGIGDAGAAHLAEGLKSNTKLTVLHLSGNGIGNDGAAHLAGALKSNKILTVLYLCKNGICDAGAAGLADALKSNATLTKLCLSGNQIGCDGLACLRGTLESNTKLSVDLPSLSPISSCF